MQIGMNLLRISGHPEIDHTHLEVMVFHPVGNFPIMDFRYEQGNAKAVQQTLDGPFPFALVFLDRNQLSGKGHFAFG